MEKLCYILWKRRELSDDDYATRILGPVAEQLVELGARGLSINVVDHYVADAEKLRITRFSPPIAGMVSLWLDMASESAVFEEVLGEVAGRLAGYLVVESVPLHNTDHVARLRERTPGVNMIACIEKPASMDYPEWIDHWHGHHREVALETQCTYEYVRNEIVRALDEDAPRWNAIVEEGFPHEAILDPMVWYRSEGNQAGFEANFARMMESVGAFLEIDRIESNPMTQYRFQEL